MQRSRDRSCERRVSADDFVINHFYEVHSLLQFIHRARERYNDNILLAKHLRNVWQFIELWLSWGYILSALFVCFYKKYK